MADKKISALTAVTSPTAADVLAIVNASTTKKVTRDDLTKHTLFIKNNLSDLSSTADARTNIQAASPYWNANTIYDIDVQSTAPVAGQGLRYNGTATKYAPTSIYSQSELTNGALDGRYYTETEVDNISTLKLNKASDLADVASTATVRTNIGADNAYWNANEIQGVDISATAPSTNEILKYNGSKWQASPDLGSTCAVWGNITGTLTNQTDLDNQLSAKIVKANNLSDLSSTATARTNIGSGNAYWNANKIYDIDVSSTAPAAGQVIQYNGTIAKYAAQNIDKNDIGLSNVENTALSTWAGTTNIVTLGTVTTGTWSGNTIALNKGGTGQITKSAAFDALSPMTTSGDITYGGASGTGTRLAGNIVAQRMFLSQLGTGAVSAAPQWFLLKYNATLTSSASITPDGNLAFIKATFILSLAHDATMNIISNLTTGCEYTFFITNTGTYTLAWNSSYKFPGGQDHILTPAASGYDMVQFMYDGSNLICIANRYNYS